MSLSHVLLTHGGIGRWLKGGWGRISNGIVFAKVAGIGQELPLVDRP